MKRTLKTALAVAGLALLASPAFAQLSANVSVASKYVWRGVTQTGDDPAVQGGLDYDFGGGFAIGAWASSVDFGDDTPFELDLYGAYTFSLMENINASVGAIGYFYPGQDNGSPDLDFGEVFAGLSYDFGAAVLSGKVYYGPETLNSATWYYTAGVSIPLVEWLTATANVGYYAWHDSAATDYTDWNVGLSTTYNRATFSIMYSDNDIANYDSDFIAMVTFKFP